MKHIGRVCLAASAVCAVLTAGCAPGGSAAEAVPPIVRVTNAVGTSDTSSRGDITPSNQISDDGRYSVFVSTATTLTPEPDANGTEFDVFLHDRVTAETTRITNGDGASSAAGISGDGGTILVTSEASNLVAGDHNGVQDVFAYDVASHTFTRLTDGNSPSFGSDVSTDGRFVVIDSAANLDGDPADVGQTDVFVVDRNAPVGTLPTRLTAGNSNSYQGSITADGNTVVFTSQATDLTADVDTNGADDVFVWNRSTGIERVAYGTVGRPIAEGGPSSSDGSISDDGRWIAFMSAADDIVPGLDANHVEDAYLRDLQTNTTTRLTNLANLRSGLPRISSNGAWVSLVSEGSLTGGVDANGLGIDVFLMQRGPNSFVRLTNGNAQPVVKDGENVSAASVSNDGKVIVYGSTATNMTGGIDLNGAASDVFLTVRS